MNLKRTEKMIDIFIPSYHRPSQQKTVDLLLKYEYPAEKIHVIIDDEGGDELQYREMADKYGIQLHIFSIEDARRRYDFIHRRTESRRAAGMSRNEFYDIAKALNIRFYCVFDDDSSCITIRTLKYTEGKKSLKNQLFAVFEYVPEFMKKYHLGVWAMLQSGDFIGGFSKYKQERIFIRKVMNWTFYDTELIYRGERGVQDNDTSQFCTIHNNGLLTGSFAQGLILHQTQSAKQSGGLTDLYIEAKLLNKSLVCPIQFPSAIYAEKQKKNGGRLHHHIQYEYLAPRILKIPNAKGNIAWDSYSEDVPFSNEPKRGRE